MNNVKIVGMCGRSGSGKGYASKRFIARGIPVIDTDKVYRGLVECENEPLSECLAELTHEFGEDIIDERGCLDRRALSEIVFAVGAGGKLNRLNKITHKYILMETQRIISNLAAKGAAAVVIDAPVLFESGFNSICDVTVFVSAPDDICIERIMQRDGISYNAALRRLASQKSEAELRSLCDDEIKNNPDADIFAEVDRFIGKYKLLQDLI